MKKLSLLIGVLVLVLVLALVAGYVYFTATRVVEVQEASPLETKGLEIKDSMDTMTAAEKEQFQKEVDEAKEKIVVMDDKMDMNQAALLAEGEFRPRAHGVMGKAQLIKAGDSKVLRFEDFETINGPELHIYLSSELGDSDFIDLGKIKATKGNVNYEIPAGTDISKYNRVLVWCKPFRVLFSYAILE